MQFVFKRRAEVRPGRFRFHNGLFEPRGISKDSKGWLGKEVLQLWPQTRIRSLCQRTLKFADDAMCRVVIACSKWAADPDTLNDPIGPEHSSAFMNCQHSRLVCRASNCNTVEAATTFLPRFPFGAKSRTFAPFARKRLYTVPREHRHRFASSGIEKYSCGTARRARRSRTAVTGMPKSAAISSTVNAVGVSARELCVSSCATAITLVRGEAPSVNYCRKCVSLHRAAPGLSRPYGEHSLQGCAYRFDGNRRSVGPLRRAGYLWQATAWHTPNRAPIATAADARRKPGDRWPSASGAGPVRWGRFAAGNRAWCIFVRIVFPRSL